MPRVENEVLLSAEPEVVWALLMDTARYADWNPRLQRIDGAFSPGAVVTLHYQQNRRWMPGRFVVDVDACVPQQELRFSGPRNVARALVRASHWFKLSPHSSGTRLAHGEDFAGALVGLIWPVLGPAVSANHADVNAALRSRLGTA